MKAQLTCQLFRTTADLMHIPVKPATNSDSEKKTEGTQKQGLLAETQKNIGDLSPPLMSGWHLTPAS